MSRGCLRVGVGAAVGLRLCCGSLAPSADLPLEMLFRMTPDRELLAVGFGGDDVGCAWMMITTGRAHAGSIDCTVGDRGLALLRPASTGSADLSSSLSVAPPSVSRGCLRVGVGAVLRWY